MTYIITDRLILRPIERTDAPRFAALCNDIDIARNTARIPHPYKSADARDFVKRSAAAFKTGEEYAFAVCRHGKIIACAGAMPTGANAVDVGYWVGASYRGDGVAAEAARAVIQFAFERHGVGLAVAGYFTDNPASGRVLEKIGFAPTGEIVKTMSAGRGHKADTMRMALNKNDFSKTGPLRVKFIP